MTTSNQLGDANELARRFVACKGWRWLPGMLTTCGNRVYDVGTYAYAIDPVSTDADNGNYMGKWLPDLSDAATRGCILELVRKAWGDPYLHCQYIIAELNQPDCWMAIADCGMARREFVGQTEAEALLAALEAAP